MNIPKKNLFLLPCVLFLVSCAATGPKFNTLDLETTEINEDKAQIVVYRVGYFGNALKPIISVDGVSTGKCETGGVFFVNVKEGNHIVSATTEAENTISFEIYKNEKVYVNCEIGIGLLIGRPKLSVRSKLEAENAIKELAFTGKFDVE